LIPHATTSFHTLSLHDALPISDCRFHPCAEVADRGLALVHRVDDGGGACGRVDVKHRPLPKLQGYPDVAQAAFANRHSAWAADLDRKSTRLNSSHGSISYAVFC